MFSRSIYDAKRRDRERGLPLCWLFETKALIWMVLIPMFLLVSFGFESLPLPVPYSSFASSFNFFPYAGLTFLHELLEEFRLYKTEGKARVEAQTKGERKSRKGGRSLVLVLTETSWFYLTWIFEWFLCSLIWIERKKKLPFLSLLFFPSTNLSYDQWPPSWIGVRKLPEKRQGAPWIELDELRFAR